MPTQTLIDIFAEGIPILMEEATVHLFPDVDCGALVHDGHDSRPLFAFFPDVAVRVHLVFGQSEILYGPAAERTKRPKRKRPNPSGIARYCAKRSRQHWCWQVGCSPKRLTRGT